MEKKSGQKYRFARDQAGMILDVTKLAGQRPVDILCLGCGNAMNTRMGPKRVHHFAHNSVSQCNFETYLHILAKNVFVFRYKEAVREGKPFVVELSHPLVCASRNDYSVCHEDLGTATRAWDLTHHFDEAHLEKRHNQYVVDVLLSSSKDPSRILYVEMCVTHASTVAKFGSARIIEINIQNESSIDDFDNFCIRAGTFESNKILIKPQKAQIQCICAVQEEQRRAAEEVSRLARLQTEELSRLARLQWEELQRRQEDIDVRFAATLAAKEEERKKQAEDWQNGERRRRQEKKAEQAEYTQWLQSQTSSMQVVREGSEWQAVSGPFVLVAQNLYLRRMPPSLAFVMANLNWGDPTRLWWDYERRITIRDERRSWKPYIVDVHGDRKYEFQRLEEAISYYSSVVR